MKPETKISLAALTVAMISLVLSQFQPLYTYFQKPIIEIIPPKQMNIAHQWGNLDLFYYLQARNMGDGTGAIYKIEYFIKSEDSKYRRRFEPKTIAMKASLNIPGMPNTVPFGPITLKPLEVWDSTIISSTPTSLAEQSRQTELGQRIRNQYQNISTNPSTNSKKISSPQNDDTSTQEARKIIEDNLQSFVPGKYYMLVLIWFDQSSTPSLMTLYEFTIFEHNRLVLKNSIDDMIGWIREGPTYVYKNLAFVTVDLTEIKDTNMIAKMYEAYRSQ